MPKGMESSHFLPVDIIRYQSGIPVLDEEDQVAIWMHGDHMVVEHASTTDPPEELLIGHPVLEGPLLRIMIRALKKNPHREPIAPSHARIITGQRRWGTFMTFFHNAMQKPLGLTHEDHIGF